jgi:hypothetical protein
MGQSTERGELTLPGQWAIAPVGRYVVVGDSTALVKPLLGSLAKHNVIQEVA